MTLPMSPHVTKIINRGSTRKNPHTHGMPNKARSSNAPSKISTTPDAATRRNEQLSPAEYERHHTAKDTT